MLESSVHSAAAWSQICATRTTDSEMGGVKVHILMPASPLAPEHPFLAAVEDAVAVYKELLRSYKPIHIGIFGTSAGAMLAAETAVKLKALGLPQPAALGIFSSMGDFARHTDLEAMYSGGGLSGPFCGPESMHGWSYSTLYPTRSGMTRRFPSRLKLPISWPTF